MLARALFAAAGILLAAGCSSSEPASAPAPKTFTMVGSIKLMNNAGGSFSMTSGGECQGKGGYSDINPGAAVLVQDGKGQTLATGALKAGTTNMITTSMPAIGISAAPFPESCTLRFEVPGVPDGVASYTVTVTHRGARVVYPAEAHGSVDLVLGQ